jgi:hypothetical protein
MYIFLLPNTAPGGAFTALHRDGMGTVDSGHTVAAGWNEVIMLRRTTGPEINEAMQIYHLQSASATEYIEGLPHEDGQREMQRWPSIDTLEKWKKAG